MKKKIEVAIVTIFNPDSSILNNIGTYLPYVEELLVIDNSSSMSAITLDLIKNPKVTLLSSSLNLGIAKALNLSIEYAYAKGYEWILTMDQDSYFNKEEIENFLHFFKEIKDERLAIFSPLHNEKFIRKDKVYNLKKTVVMTSANIISVEKALLIKGFNEKLFIDEVDHDFCLRLKEAKYDIYQNYNCFVYHTLGRKIKGMSIYPSERLYYMVRNYLYVRKSYRKEFFLFFKSRDKYLIKFFVKQILYGKNRQKNLGMIYKGIKDYIDSTMGYQIKL